MVHLNEIRYKSGQIITIQQYKHWKIEKSIGLLICIFLWPICTYALYLPRGQCNNSRTTHLQNRFSSSEINTCLSIIRLLIPFYINVYFIHLSQQRRTLTQWSNFFLLSRFIFKPPKFGNLFVLYCCIFPLQKIYHAQWETPPSTRMDRNALSSFKITWFIRYVI